jgi:hypothetical protein
LTPTASHAAWPLWAEPEMANGAPAARRSQAASSSNESAPALSRFAASRSDAWLLCAGPAGERFCRHQRNAPAPASSSSSTISPATPRRLPERASRAASTLCTLNSSDAAVPPLISAGSAAAERNLNLTRPTWNTSCVASATSSTFLPSSSVPLVEPRSRST